MASREPIWWTQLRASVRLAYLQASRAPVDVVTGRRGSRPLLTIAVTEAFLGLFFSLGGTTRWAAAESSVDMDSMKRGLLSAALLAALLQAGFILVPDSLEHRRRTVEILGVKPLKPRTQFVAVLVSTAVVTGTLIAAFMIPVLAHLSTFGLTFLQSLAALVVVLSAGSSASIAWQLLTQLLARRFGFDAVRGVAMGVLMLGMASSVFLVPMLGQPLAEDARLGWVPTTWMAEVILDSAGARVAAPGLAVLITSPLALAWWATSPARRSDLNETLLEARHARPSTPMGLVALAVLERSVPRRWLSAGSIAVTRLVALSTSREALHSISVWPWRLLLLGNVGLAAVGPAELARSGVAVSAALLFVEGFRTTQHSTSASATVMVRTAPVSVREALEGQWLAVLLGDYWIAIVVTTIVLAMGGLEPWVDGRASTLPIRVLVAPALLLVESRVVLFFLAGFGRSLPLSRDAQTKVQLPSFLFGLAFGLVSAVRDWLLADGSIGLFTYFVVAAGLLPISRRFAERRLS
ncbi:MAG: hypothetical protein HY791_28215 [Deltaproteobacteria bacterium]|nr:hypothetical protein [Deltaproteobacteria bacterium]